MFQHLKKVDTYSEKLREKFSEKNLYLFDAETISYEIPGHLQKSVDKS